MTHPRRYLVRMIIFLGAVIVLAGLPSGGIREAFMANAIGHPLVMNTVTADGSCRIKFAVAHRQENL